MCRLWRISFLLPLILSFASCSPVYVPPPDPFELENFEYQRLTPWYAETLQRACDSSHWYEAPAAEKAKFADSVATMKLLVSNEHAPTMDRLGRLLICHASSYEADGGWNGKFKAQYRKHAKEQKLNKEKLDLRFANEKELGLKLLRRAAMYGYPPSQDALRTLNEPVPPVSLVTRPQRAARAGYAIAVAEHNKRMQGIADAINKSVDDMNRQQEEQRMINSLKSQHCTSTLIGSSVSTSCW